MGHSCPKLTLAPGTYLSSRAADVSRIFLGMRRVNLSPLYSIGWRRVGFGHIGITIVIPIRKTPFSTNRLTTPPQPEHRIDHGNEAPGGGLGDSVDRLRFWSMMPTPQQAAGRRGPAGGTQTRHSVAVVLPDYRERPPLGFRPRAGCSTELGLATAFFCCFRSFARSTSICCTIWEGGTFRTSATLTKVRIVGLRTPLSMRLMYVRSRPASRANRSWEMSWASRISLSAWPNTFSGPEIGWMCPLLLDLGRGCAKQPMLIRCRPYAHGQ